MTPRKAKPDEPLQVDPIIHAPARFQIMANLYLVKESDFLFLLKQTGLTKGNLSAHLMKLEKAEYITIEKTFVDKISRTIIAISKNGKKAFENYRKTMKRMLG